MGQFREAAETEEAPENVPSFGPLFVMRQPHDSAVRWSVRGGRGSSGRGQRYGWMELLSLLSHGAHTIAAELLSTRRTAAPWMAMECAILKFSDARLAATKALNRYLQFAGCRIEGRELIFPKHEGYHLIAGAFSEDLAKGFVARSGSRRELNEIEDHLEDEKWWLSHPGGAYIELGAEPVTIKDNRWTLKRGTPEDKGKALHLRFQHLPILPPWLRPATEIAPNKLTSSYRRVLRLIANKAAWKESGSTAWLWCVRRALGQSAREQRRMVGGRYFNRLPGEPPRAGFDYNVETGFQWGTFGNRQIRAWGAGGNFGWTLSGPVWPVRFGLQADAISGDNGQPGTLGTLNAFFPRGAYFGPKFALIGPANSLSVQPQFVFHPLRNVTGIPVAADTPHH